MDDTGEVTASCLHLYMREVDPPPGVLLLHFWARCIRCQVKEFLHWMCACRA